MLMPASGDHRIELPETRRWTLACSDSIGHVCRLSMILPLDALENNRRRYVKL
jgi:hypothetical protein